MDTAQASTRRLINAYLNGFAGQQIRVPRFRISQYGAFRVAQLFSNGTGPATGPTANDADYPTTKLQVQLTGLAPQRTFQWFGGIADTSTTGGGFWTPTPDVATAFNSLVALLTTGSEGWGIYVLNPASPRLVVTNVDGTTGIVTTATNHGFATNDYVRIQRVNGIPGINGVWQITALTSPTQFQLIGWVSTTSVMTKSNGRVQAQGRVIQQITGVTPVQVTSHRVGRPTSQLGGRRKRPSKALAGPLVPR
jgi:hypothetical protein